MLRTAPLVALLALSACKNGETDTAVELGPYHWEHVEDLGPVGRALSSPLAVAGESQWWDDGGTWRDLGPAPLQVDRVSLLATIPGEHTLLAWVDGLGLHRAPTGETWGLVEPQPSSAVLTTLDPRGHVTPFGWAQGASTGEAWLAALGGVFRTVDDGLSWDQVDIPGGSALYTDVAVDGSAVVAVSPRPAGLVPADYADLLLPSVLVSEDGGASWEDRTGDAPFRYPAGVAQDDEGRVLVAAMDGGLYREDDGAWTSLGGPTDAVEVAWFKGGAAVASATSGLWRWEPEAGWTAADAGSVADLDGGVALDVDGGVWSLAEGPGEPPPESAGGQVYIALSHEIGLYRSDRGDTPDADGYGADLEALRTTLDTLDARPHLHADWDMDGYFSLQGWLQSDGADVLARIQGRVGSGQDGVRLMSWNNGALAAQTHEEFDASIVWAQNAYDEAFGMGLWDPGVQPQGSMFTRDHVGWYSDLGVQWVTLYYSGTPYTALRQELALSGDALYNPVTLADGEHALVLVPAYHHADVADHGGLAGWARQLHDSQPGDSLLLIHLDAGSPLWEPFAAELDSVEDLDFVHHTTIQDYLDAHPPVAEVDAPHDVAAGSGDGFQSWAEKAIDHELATSIARAREDTHRALALAGSDEEVIAAADDALRPRLLALSAAHFGPATPALHEQRRVRARDYADDALAAARRAYGLATGSCGSVSLKTIEVVNTRDTGGVALVRAVLKIPEDTWAGPEGVLVTDPDGAEIPVAVGIRSGATDPVLVDVGFALPLAPRERVELGWDYDVDLGERATGDLAVEDLTWDHLPLALPFTECDGERSEADTGPHWNPAVDDRSVRGSESQGYHMDLCDATSLVTWTWTRWDGLPGVILEVEGDLGEPGDPLLAESVALSPLVCDGAAEVLSWRSMGGTLRSRPVRQGQETWNASAADGWVSLTCADGTEIAVAHDVGLQTSLAFAPLRTSEADAVLAPLGTLYGDPPRHDARRTGGHGLGDVVAGIVGSRFAPSAPDWAGMPREYALLIGGDELDPGTMDLFAHPPEVRAGYLTGG